MPGVGRQPLTGETGGITLPALVRLRSVRFKAADLGGRWHRRVRPARRHQSRHSGSGERDRPQNVSKCHSQPGAEDMEPPARGSRV